MSAQPKKKHTRSRSNKRRGGHKKLKLPKVGKRVPWGRSKNENLSRSKT